MKKKIISLCVCIIILNLLTFYAGIHESLAVETENSELSIKAIDNEVVLIDDGKAIDQNTNIEKKESIQIGDIPTIELKTENIVKGEEFEVSVYLNSNKGISTAEFTIKYDEGLEFTGSEKQNNINTSISENNTESKVQISIVSDNELTEKNLITKLKFKTSKKEKQDKTYKISVEKVDKLFSSKNGDILNFEASDLSIFIKGNTNSGNAILIVVAIVAVIIVVALAVGVVIVIKGKNKRI